MREFALVLIIAAIGGIGFWFWKADLNHAIQSSNALQPAPAPAAAQKPEPVRAHSKQKPRQAAPAALQESADLQRIPAAAAATQKPEEALAPPPFPAVEQIARGDEEIESVGRYGDPTLSTTTSDRGHVFETLFYARDRGQLQTLVGIRVTDGKVLSASEESMPDLIHVLTPATRVRH